MSWKTTITRIRGLLTSKADRDRELRDEMLSHIELQTAENIDRGMDPVEARRTAHLALGNLQVIHEESRAKWSLPSIESVVADVRFGWRVLWKSPVFALVSVLTLAVGIGSTTSMFTITNAVLLRDMPYPEAHRIVLVWGSDGKADNRSQVSFTDTEDIRKRNSVFSSVANFADWTPTLSGLGEAERLAATQVSDGFFDVIGVQPSLGRPFTREEHIDGRDRVVILSYELWKTRFNADRSVLGRTITLNSVPHVVVGVMPESFEGLPSTLVQGGQLYRPTGETYDDTQRRSDHLRAIARLKPGITVQQADKEIELLARGLEADHPKEDADLHFHVSPLQEDTGHQLRPSLVVLTWATAVLLMIACANVAGLLLARGNARVREFVVRSALGAGQVRLLRQSLTESLLLGSLGGLCGLAIAYAAMQISRSLAPKLGTPLAHVAFDPGVLAFAALTAMVTSVVFGLAPALHSTSNLSDELKRGSHTVDMGRGSRRLQSSIVVIELALALTLLTTATLLIQSFVRLQRVDVGFEPEERLVMNVWLPFAKYKQPQQQIAYYEELLRRVTRLPGVNSAAIVQNPPVSDFDGRAILPEGRADVRQNILSPQAYVVSPTYLRTMGIPLVEGREFTASDNENSALVAMVSKNLATEMFPGERVIGKRLQLLSDKKLDGKYPFRTIVGVVGDVRHFGPDGRESEGLYVPYRQFAVPFMSLVVHSRKPLALAKSIRRDIAEMDSDVAAFKIGSYTDFLADALLIRRIAMILIATFGATALFLAAVGVYGLLSYVVSLRMREFGLRAALGARPTELVSLVLASAVRLISVGAVAGVAGSFIATRLAGSTIVGSVSPDRLTIGASTAILLFVALIASFIPARMAAQADPSVTLRAE